MRLITPPPPTARDTEIYQAVIVSRQSQAEVAAIFKISQPRVCQIIAKVRRWLAKRARPWEEQGYSIHSHRYLAFHEERLRLEHDYDWHRQLIERMASPQIDVAEHKRGDEVIKIERRSKFGKVAASHFKELRAQRLSILDVTLQQQDAYDQMHVEMRKNCLWLEDSLAIYCRRYVQTLCKLHGRLARLGARLTPLPEIDWNEIELAFRANHRDGERTATTISNFLPPVWAEIANEVFNHHHTLRQPAPAQPVSGQPDWERELRELEALEEREEAERQEWAQQQSPVAAEPDAASEEEDDDVSRYYTPANHPPGYLLKPEQISADNDTTSSATTAQNDNNSSTYDDQHAPKSAVKTPVKRVYNPDDDPLVQAYRRHVTYRIGPRYDQAAPPPQHREPYWNS